MGAYDQKGQKQSKSGVWKGGCEPYQEAAAPLTGQEGAYPSRPS